MVDALLCVLSVGFSESDLRSGFSLRTANAHPDLQTDPREREREREQIGGTEGCGCECASMCHRCGRRRKESSLLTLCLTFPLSTASIDRCATVIPCGRAGVAIEWVSGSIGPPDVCGTSTPRAKHRIPLLQPTPLIDPTPLHTSSALARYVRPVPLGGHALCPSLDARGISISNTQTDGTIRKGTYHRCQYMHSGGRGGLQRCTVLGLGRCMLAQFIHPIRSVLCV